MAVGKRLALIADTNFFLEYQRLSAVNLSPFAAQMSERFRTDIQQIDFIVSRPVQRELDRIKNTKKHLKQRRAAEYVKQFGEILDGSDQDFAHVISEGPPLIRITLCPKVPIDSMEREWLDKSYSDDQILLTALSLRDHLESDVVALLTEDIAMRLSANWEQISCIKPPSSWRIATTGSENKRSSGAKLQVKRFSPSGVEIPSSGLHFCIKEHVPLLLGESLRLVGEVPNITEGSIEVGAFGGSPKVQKMMEIATPREAKSVFEKRDSILQRLQGLHIVENKRARRQSFELVFSVRSHAAKDVEVTIRCKATGGGRVVFSGVEGDIDTTITASAHRGFALKSINEGTIFLHAEKISAVSGEKKLRIIFDIIGAPVGETGRSIIDVLYWADNMEKRSMSFPVSWTCESADLIDRARDIINSFG